MTRSWASDLSLARRRKNGKNRSTSFGKILKRRFFYSVEGIQTERDYTMTIERPAKGVRQHLLPLKASSIQKTESMEWRIA